MGIAVFFMFLALAVCLGLALYRRGAAGRRLRWVRTAVVLFCAAVFSYWFVQRSISRFIPDSLAVQINNLLPQPLDFYIIKKIKTDTANIHYETEHIGKIRPEFYRIEYLQLPKSDEFWVAGYLGKKNLAYFSRHLVPNKNMDQIIDIQNYKIDDARLSETAQKEVSAYSKRDISRSIWITLCLLLLFMNSVLLFRK